MLSGRDELGPLKSRDRSDLRPMRDADAMRAEMVAQGQQQSGGKYRLEEGMDMSSRVEMSKEVKPDGTTILRPTIIPIPRERVPVNQDGPSETPDPPPTPPPSGPLSNIDAGVANRLAEIARKRREDG